MPRLDFAGKRRRRILRGYTLTEMLVVIGIIGLISAVVIPQTVGQLGRAQSRAAKLQVQNMAAAVELFAADNGRPPFAAEGLAALIKSPSGLDSWSGPYVRSAEQLKDPWGAPLVYRAPGAPGGAFEVGTFGADAKPGGDGADRDVFMK